MKLVQNIFEKIHPLVEKDGKRNVFYPLYDSIHTLFFVPGHAAQSGAHVRDAIDMKRTMMMVIFALVPALLFGMWNAGYWHYTALGVESTLL
jgi:Na+-transporting NADH:ubiquinone oxidoreductase subunit B